MWDWLQRLLVPRRRRRKVDRKPAEPSRGALLIRDALADMLAPIDDGIRLSMHQAFWRRWFAGEDGRQFAIDGSGLLDLWKIPVRPTQQLELTAVASSAARKPAPIVIEACHRNLADGFTFEADQVHQGAPVSGLQFRIPWEYQSRHRRTLLLAVTFDKRLANLHDWLTLPCTGEADESSLRVIRPEGLLAGIFNHLLAPQRRDKQFFPRFLLEARQIAQNLTLDQATTQLVVDTLLADWKMSPRDFETLLHDATHGDLNDPTWDDYLKEFDLEPLSRHDAWLDVREALEYAQAGEALPNLEERAFLAAIRADREDEGVRLSYADWLEGRGDQRAEYLRLDCQLDAAETFEAIPPEVPRRLAELRQSLSARWVKQIRWE